MVTNARSGTSYRTVRPRGEVSDCGKPRTGPTAHEGDSGSQEKLRLISAERGQYDEPTTLLAVGRPLTVERSASARLDARLDTAYDEVAEAKVAHDEAVEDLRRVQQEEGADDGQR